MYSSRLEHTIYNGVAMAPASSNNRESGTHVLLNHLVVVGAYALTEACSANGCLAPTAKSGCLLGTLNLIQLGPTGMYGAYTCVE